MKRRQKLTASQVNDYIFMAFPAGWFGGIFAGTVWAGFHWTTLQHEMGRSLLAAVTVGQVTTLLRTTFTIRRIIR